MPKLKKIRNLAAKIEGTIGTAESLTAAEGVFNAYNLMFQPTISKTVREAPGSFNRLTSVSEGQLATITFRTELAWGGTSTEPAIFSVLMPCCGWTESTNVWKPRSEAPGSNVKTCTMGCYVDGVLKTIKGAVGTWTMVLVAGQPIFIDWSFTGVYVEPTDTAIIAPTYPTDNVMRFASASACSYNSVSLKTQNMTIAANNEITSLEDPTNATGYSSCIIVDRAPTIVCNPEMESIATQNRHNIFTDGLAYSLAVTLDGPTNSTLGILAPKAEIGNIQEGERGKIVTDEITFNCTKNGATQNEELYFTFTPAS
jgi:hypothetical protein